MKKIYLALSLAFIVNSEFVAQSEIWGVNTNGANGYGSIYTLPTGSTGISAQYTFSGSIGSSPQYSKLLEVPSGKLYGVVSSGGANNGGVLFEYDTLTNNYVKKYDFVTANGIAPNGSLMRASNGKLYGMTRLGGTNSVGVIFEYDLSTNVYTKKVDFTGTTGAAMGAQPYGTLIESAPGSGKLYGMTRMGGANNIGVIFEYDYVNNTYTKKVDFTGNTGSFQGSNPFGQLIKANGNLFYGLTFQGGSSGTGVLFEYDYVNDVYTKKIDLVAGTTGSSPFGSLIQVGANLYGVTFQGGAGTPAAGVIFRYDYSLNVLTKLVDLSGGAGAGANPMGDLSVATNGKLYGTTRFGGVNNQGVIFELDLVGPTYTKKIDLATATLGGLPFGSLIQVSTGKMYGYTSAGGAMNAGVIFQYHISANTYTKKIDCNFSEGVNPSGHLIQATNGRFYGMTTNGGGSVLGALGTLFEYNKATQTYTKKIDFNITGGNTPYGSLVQAANGKLYGLTSSGGANALGSLFEYDITGNTFTKRADFNSTVGSEPYGSMTMSVSTGKLYGLTKGGGANNQGVIFEFDPSTNIYTKKIDMLAANGYSAYGSLVESSGKFYGMTSLGGANNLGVIFEYDPGTNTYTKKIDFTGTTGAAIGSNPFGSLVTTSTVGVLYGMTRTGGANDLGVIFEYNISGNIYTKKYDLTAANGSLPLGSLIRAANDRLYGVTNAGGINSSGVLFEYAISSGVYTKKIDFSVATGNNPSYTQLLEVCTKPETPGAITSSTNSICFGDASSKNFSISTVANATSYAWSLPSGAAITSGSTIANIVTNLSGVGVGSYTFGVAGVNECGTGTISANTFTINSLPLINVNSGPICAGSVFTIIPGGASTYSVQGNSFQVSPSSNTTYTVVGYNSFGCASSNIPSASVTVNSLPIIGVNNGTVCAGTPFTMIPTGVISSTPSGGSLIVSPTTSTFYTITGTDGNGCVSANTATSNVLVNPLPSISMSSRTMCANGSATLSPTGASNYTIGALIGAGPFVVSPTSTTNYTVVGVSSLGCISSNTPAASVTVYTLPIISVNSPTMCLNQTAVINPSGAGTSGTYTVGSSNGAGPFNVSPTSSTNYNVTGTSSLGCVSSGVVVSAVTVFSLPIVSVSNGTVCNGLTHTFVPSGATSYTMTGPLVGTSFTVSPSASTSYTFMGTSPAGCVSAFPPTTANLTVYALPVVSVTSASMCAGTSATIIASGGGTSATYTVGSFNGAGPFVFSPSVTTLYGAGVTNSLGCVSVNSAFATVSVVALPVVSAQNGTICLGQVFATTVSGASSYTYTGPSSTVTSVGSVTYSPPNTTNYNVSGTSSVGCVSLPAPMIIFVNALPVLSVSSASNGICIGESATLTASGANTYNWGTSTNTTIVVSPVVSTIYSVTGTDLNGCSNQTVYPLTVNVLPTINVISGAICPGNCFTLTPSGALTYTYLTGSSVVCPSVTSDYSVTGTSADGCVAPMFGVATVSVVNILTVTISGNTSVCLGGTLNLTANGASTYNWSTGDATNAVTISPTANTTYSVLGSSGTCSNTASISVTVNPLPTVTAVSERSIICLQESVELTAGGAVSYLWNTSSTSPSLMVSPSVNTNYTVTGTDANGCVNTAVVSILVSECVGINQISTSSWQYAVYPNPNQGEFIIETSEQITAVIVNAIGQSVSTQQLYAGKNSINLNSQAKGVYFVQLKNANSTKIIKVVKQ